MFAQPLSRKPGDTPCQRAWSAVRISVRPGPDTAAFSLIFGQLVQSEFRGYVPCPLNPPLWQRERPGHVTDMWGGGCGFAGAVVVLGVEVSGFARSVRVVLGFEVGGIWVLGGEGFSETLARDAGRARMESPETN